VADRSRRRTACFQLAEHLAGCRCTCIVANREKGPDIGAPLLPSNIPACAPTGTVSSGPITSQPSAKSVKGRRFRCTSRRPASSSPADAGLAPAPMGCMSMRALASLHDDRGRPAKGPSKARHGRRGRQQVRPTHLTCLVATRLTRRHPLPLQLSGLLSLQVSRRRYYVVRGGVVVTAGVCVSQLFDDRGPPAVSTVCSAATVHRHNANANLGMAKCGTDRPCSLLRRRSANT